MFKWSGLNERFGVCQIPFCPVCPLIEVKKRQSEWMIETFKKREIFKFEIKCSTGPV